MLSYLHVKNLALIDEAEVEFGPGLNILTGETGAGKSILMGSVNLALGQKMSREMLRNPQEAALVELVFHVDNPRCLEELKKKEIYMEDGQVIISRKLTGNRSISRLNGEICTASQIREISSSFLIFTVSTNISPYCIRIISWNFWMPTEKSRWKIKKNRSDRNTKNGRC